MRDLGIVIFIFLATATDAYHTRGLFYRSTVGRPRLNVPSVLHVVAPDQVGIVLQGFDVVREAMVPRDVDGAIAIGISEAVAGGVGALLSRGVANAVGDKKLDSVQTKVTSTSAYFGARSITRGVARIIGLPGPIALVLASVTGSLVSETAKATLRKRSETAEKTAAEKKLAAAEPSKTDRKSVRSKKVQVEKVSEPEQNFLQKARSVISLREVGADVTKWVVFDILSDSYVPDAFQGASKNFVYFTLGSISALAGNFVKRLPSRNVNDKAIRNVREKSALVSYSQAAIEGGVLFTTYSFALFEAMEIVPSDLNQDFIFSKVLIEGEEAIAEQEKKLGVFL